MEKHTFPKLITPNGGENLKINLSNKFQATSFSGNSNKLA